MKKIKTFKTLLKRRSRNSVIAGCALGLITGAVLILCAFSPDSAEAVYAEEDPVRSVESLQTDKDYLEDMSEEELVSLSKEALENSGKDTSLTEGELVTRGIGFDIPEGFAESEEVPGMYVLKRYPIDASNIVYTKLDADYTLQLMDEEYFRQLIADSFAAGYGNDVDVTISSFEHISIDGVPAVRLECEYDLEDNHFTQLMVAVNGTETYMVCYTQTQDYDRMADFRASADSIRVLK